MVETQTHAGANLEGKQTVAMTCWVTFAAVLQLGGEGRLVPLQARLNRLAANP